MSAFTTEALQKGNKRGRRVHSRTCWDNRWINNKQNPRSWSQQPTLPSTQNQSARLIFLNIPCTFLCLFLIPADMMQHKPLRKVAFHVPHPWILFMSIVSTCWGSNGSRYSIQIKKYCYFFPPPWFLHPTRSHYIAKNWIPVQLKFRDVATMLGLWSQTFRF